MGDSTPTDDDHKQWGRSRRNYESGSEIESSDDDSDTSSIQSGDSRASHSRASKSGKPTSKGKRFGVFSVGQDSSDYESDGDAPVQPPARKSSLFKDLIYGSKSIPS